MHYAFIIFYEQKKNWTATILSAIDFFHSNPEIKGINIATRSASGAATGATTYAVTDAKTDALIDAATGRAMDEATGPSA